MECLALHFVNSMEALLFANKIVIATVGKKGGGLFVKVKHGPESLLLEFTQANRDTLLSEVIAWLDGISIS